MFPPRSRRELDHLVVRVVAHLAEAPERGDIEVDRSSGLVRVPLVEHHADEPADVGDRGCGARLAVAGQHVQCLHVAVEARHLTCGEIEIVDTELARLGQQRIVDVSDVADTASVVAEVAQAALQHVVDDVHRRMPEVRRVVRRDAARVHRDEMVGLERHDLPARRVVQTHGHG